MNFLLFKRSVLVFLFVISSVAYAQYDDYFPLAVGNSWTYNYNTYSYNGLADIYSYTYGKATYTVISKSVGTDSIMWSLKEVRDVIVDINYYFPGPDTSYPFKDSANFNIIEYLNGRHRLITINYPHSLWELPFYFDYNFRDSSTVYRYYPKTSPDTVSFKSQEPIVDSLNPYPSYYVNFSFKRSTGLVMVAYSTSQYIVGASDNTNDTLESAVITSIRTKQQNHIPNEFWLDQNYPNPFNPTTVIRYSIPDVETRYPNGSGQVTSSVQLRVYNILGGLVATLVDKKQNPGAYEVKFNASKLSSGVYFYRLTAGNYLKTLKMIAVK